MKTRSAKLPKILAILLITSQKLHIRFNPTTMNTYSNWEKVGQKTYQKSNSGVLATVKSQVYQLRRQNAKSPFSWESPDKAPQLTAKPNC